MTDKAKIVFVTKSMDKLKEIEKILEMNFTSLLPELNKINFEQIENGNSYRENAEKKARLCSLPGYSALADDSGVEISFFGGKPGIFSSTFLTANENFKERNRKILQLMENAEDRSAKYVCTIALVHKSLAYFTQGELEGSIAYAPAGEGGFAYDEIFIPKGYNKTLAQFTIDEKNKISHRNIALGKMKDLLQRLINFSA